MSGMPSITSTFQRLVEGLELTPGQREQADRKQRDVRAMLARGLTLYPGRPTFLTGSFARGTAIRRLKDIDLFAVLDPGTYGVLRDRPPAEALLIVREVLDAAYPDKGAPITQDHTVRVDFGEKRPSFEVVPALPLDDGIYTIPQKTTGRWIKSNPDAHAAILRAANGRTSGAVAVLTKLAKHYKRVVGDRGKIASFHLEMMICDLVTARPHDYPTGLRDVFAQLADRVKRPLPDPAEVGPAIDERLSPADRSRLAEVFDAAADTADRAIRLAQSDPAGAHWLWRDLLGDVYPVKGRKPQSAPAVFAAPAVDAPGSRFG